MYFKIMKLVNYVIYILCISCVTNDLEFDEKTHIHTKYMVYHD